MEIRHFYMNYHLRDGLGVETYESKMMPKGALTSFALYDASRSLSASRHKSAHA